MFLLTLPIILRKKLDILHPFIYLFFAFGIGGFLRTFYLLSSSNVYLLKYNIKSEYLTLALLYALIGNFSLLIGYLLKLKKHIIVKFPFFNPKKWGNKRFWIIYIIFLFIGLISFYIFIKNIGTIKFSLTGISKKRSISNNYIRLGNKFLFINYYLSLMYFLKNKQYSYLSFKFVGVVISFLLAVIPPFISSNRGPIIISILITLLTYHYYIKKIKIKKLVFLLIVLIILLTFMGGLRKGSHLNYSLNQIINFGNFKNIISNFVTGHYFFDITTLSKTIQSIPNEIDFYYGKTLVNWIVFPIPRSIWENKPQNLGQIIGEKIYNKGVGVVGGGVPPGFIAELYINFNLIGIIIGMFIMGLFLKIIYSFVRFNKNNIFAVVLYAVLINYTWLLYTSDLTSYFVDLLQMLVPLLFAISFICKGKLVVIE